MLRITLLSLLLSCSILKPGTFKYIELGTLDSDIQADYYVEDIFDSKNHRYIGLYDGIVVTDKNKVIGKVAILQGDDLPVKVQALTTNAKVEGKVFISPAQFIDSKSIQWKNAKRMIRTILELQGLEVVDTLDTAQNVLAVAYGIEHQRTVTLTQGMAVIKKEIIYSKRLNLALFSKAESDTYVWETKIHAEDHQDDMNILLPAMIAAAGKYLNKNVPGTLEGTVTRGNVIRNILLAPSEFVKYEKITQN